MKRTLTSVLLILVLVSGANSQRKQKLIKLAKAPGGDVLYPKSAYVKGPGWRLASAGLLDAEKKQAFAYYDPSRIVKSTIGYRAWVKYVSKESGVIVSYTLALEDHNCDRRQTLVVEATEYDGAGAVVRSAQSVSAWTNVIPDSMRDNVQGILCRGAMDAQEANMRLAQRYFSYGWDDEKGGYSEGATHWYYLALKYDPSNQKILLAIRRIDPLGIEPFANQPEIPTLPGVSELERTAHEVNRQPLPKKKKPIKNR